MNQNENSNGGTAPMNAGMSWIRVGVDVGNHFIVLSEVVEEEME